MVALISVMILVYSVLQQVTPILFKFIVDQIEAQIVKGEGDVDLLAKLIVVSFVVNAFALTLNSINQRLGDYLASRLGKFLTETFYQKLLTLPQKYFDNEVSGKIMNQLTRGIFSIQDFFSSSTNFILPAILQSIFTLVVLAYFYWPIALIALCIFPLYIGVSHYSTKKWGEREVKKNKIEDKARGRLVETVANIKLVRAFNNQFNEWSFVSNLYGKINKIYDKQSTTYHKLNFAREFLLEGIMMIVIVMVFYNTFQGIFSLGTMVLVLQLLNQLRFPLFATSFILERVQRAEAGSKEFFSVMVLESEEAFLESQVASSSEKTSLEFENVAFAYNRNKPVLRDVSFRLDQGQSVALVGHSGAGKSTLINLILKFYQPTSGQILLGGKRYSDLSHQEIRSYISLVFQENELFSASVRDNVAYGKPKASDEEVINALKQANAYEFVKKLDKGLHSQIGERGVRLSGGQKQRLQIARAIIHNTPILILDEATSSLDSKTEHLVQEALERLFKNRLVVIIAHRFSTIQNVDKVIVLEKGKIEAMGSPQELSKKPGVYQDLLKYQIEGNKKLLSKYELA